ncbi:glutamyl aminopeptidase-like isoform X3 [Bolinopsis microptera]|uniref:glutamyl aminopeptidase-like isoform X3 n=1 Tax=Bolinopsis microptera TaxID=2820187 RepID=UPI00307A6FD7
MAVVGVCTLIFVAVIISVTTSVEVDPGPLDGPWDNIRLPENIAAKAYTMTLNINWGTMNYTGVQEVTMEVTGDDTKYFLIHTSGLVIDKTATTLHKVVGDVVTDLDIKRTFMDTEKKAELRHDFYVVESTDAVTAGTYKMIISFAGQVQTEKLTGIYRSKYIRKYQDDTEVPIYQISTDFEPVDARTAFPCFDEPAQKANWTTSIKVTFPPGIDINEYNILSNMPLKEAPTKENQIISAKFKESVPMSTYLVCFAVSDFIFKEAVHTRADGSTVLMRVHARREPEFQASASYALQVTPAIIKEYEKFYKVNYPLEKLDQIALPEFNSGAMENWGLITYRESSLLYNPVTSSTAEKQRVCSVIAHEVAHQWFGNLVTMAWWNDLWLNEGFASFVEYYGIDAAEPTWNILDFFYPDEVTTAMNFDSSPSSHPISVQVSSPEELSGLFDTISYRKGSSINWMMQKFMGDENFATGLENYIATNKYGNAYMVDLFDALNPAYGGVNVTKVMLTWTLQMGFPYVTAALDTTTTPGSTIITLEQNRFLVGDAKEDDTSEFGYKWHIPFSYVYKVKDGAVETGVTHWLMADDESSKTITVEKELEWIKGNADGNFYYLSNYEEATWTALASALQNGELTSATDKTSLVYDVFRLAETAKVAYSKALDMTKYAKAESEYVVLSRILSEVLTAGDGVRSDETAYTELWKYVAAMLKPRVEDMTWDPKIDNEPITSPKMRDMALRNYCRAVKDKSDAYVVEALNKFTEFAKDPAGKKSGIKDVFTTVMRTAIIYDDTENTNWHKMWKLLQDSDWEADQRIYIAALARSSNTTVLRQMIEDSFSEDAKAGTWRYLYYVSYHGDNYDLAWELLQSRWDEYAVQYNTTSFTMGYLVQIPEVFDTQEMYDEVKKFFDGKESNIGTGKKTVEETLAKIKSNIKWKKEHFESVKTWFTDLGSK